MAQIINLQPTNVLGEDDETILRQGTIDKRIRLNLAETLGWARRNGYNYIGAHIVGSTFTTTKDFTIYQGKAYFVKNGVSSPYISGQADPSTDTNLYVWQDAQKGDLISKGEWTPSTDVEIGGIYGYQGSEWRSLTGVSGIAPVEGNDWREYLGKSNLPKYTDLVFNSTSDMVARGGYTTNPVMFMKVQGEKGQFVNYVTSASGEVDLGGGVFAKEVPQKFDNATSVNEAIFKNRFGYNNHISNTLQLFAHRGFDYGSEPRKTPENTLLAISTALQSGVTGIEIDVCISADGVAYLFHDQTVDALTDGTGAFTQLSSAYIDTLRFSTVAGTIYADEPIPRLEDALKLCRRWGAHLIAEIKYYPDYSDVENMLALIDNASMKDITTVASGGLSLLAQIRDTDRLINLAHIISVPSQSDIDALANIGNTSVMMNESAVRVAVGGDPSIVRYAKSKGVDVFCYTIADTIIADEVRVAGVNKLIASRLFNLETR